MLQSRDIPNNSAVCVKAVIRIRDYTSVTSARRLIYAPLMPAIAISPSLSPMSGGHFTPAITHVR